MDKIDALSFARTVRKHLHTSERGELLQYFTDEANRERKGKYKPLPLRFYAVKLSHLSIADLYYLKSICVDVERRGGSWAQCFWGSLKAKLEQV